MEITKEQLLERGWKTIGHKGSLEYMANIGEYGEILYLPLQDGKGIGIVQSIPEDVLELIINFTLQEEDE